MTIADAKKFYAQDKQEYIPEKNKEFMTWLYAHLQKGYNPYLTLEGMTALIEKIKNWYELKYPNRELELQDGVTDMNFKGINNISEQMNFEQLRYRLTHAELHTLDCEYRSTSGYCRPNWGGEDDLVADGQTWIDYIGFKVNATYSNEMKVVKMMSATAIGGFISSYEMAYLEEFLSETPSQTITIKDLISMIKSSSNIESPELDFIEYTHQTDLELRSKILNMAALALIYSKNTTPEHGQKRALSLMNDTMSAYKEPLTYLAIEVIMGDKPEKKSKLEEIKTSHLARKVKKLEKKMN